ncbi:hypothetical protein P8452_60374 [Trifolium repens]|nr:hypothetical protein P8452_60374 [Trifolium repens]
MFYPEITAAAFKSPAVVTGGSNCHVAQPRSSSSIVTTIAFVAAAIGHPRHSSRNTFLAFSIQVIVEAAGPEFIILGQLTNSITWP